MSENSDSVGRSSAALPSGMGWEDATLLDPRKIGVACFLCSEAAFFTTLLVAYALYMGKDASGPTPSDTLSLPLVAVNTIMLLSSSGTIVLAMRGYRQSRFLQFRMYLGMTVLLGAAFIVGTGIEWSRLINDHGLTISRNLFGTTFYTLIGFHAFHVTIGLLVMVILLCLEMRGRLATKSPAAELVSWYWHFVDGVWIVVFSLVYVIGRS
jgi:cytochrome c oxidase subunit 3/cytochrome o ubiquinol oxidase subunit 3